MMKFEINEGTGKTRITLVAMHMGNDIVVTIFNEKAHIGAVAFAEYAFNEERTSVSIITRLGHKDDIIAQKTAHTITKNLQKASCVIAGVHIDNINKSEIREVERNCDVLASRLVEFLAKQKPISDG